jgi:hypothetical protein
MRHAPSVMYPVGRSAFWGALLLLVGLWLALVLALARDGLAWWQCLGLGLAVALWWLMAARDARHQPQGWLQFSASPLPHEPDDAGWAWLREPGGDAVPLQRLRMVLDLQQRLLLQASGGEGAPRWIWLEAARAPADWLALRRAVQASAVR